MGLGKSAQCIRASDILNNTKILIICPTTAQIKWTREFIKFSIFSHDFHIIKDKKDSGGVEDVGGGHKNIICGYGLLQSFYNNLIKKSENSACLKKGFWDLIIVDEAHCLKNFEAKRTRAVLGKKGLIRGTRKLWFVTGTPAPNNASELWPMLFTVGRTNLNFNNFVERYCTYIDSGYGRQITGTNEEMTPQIREMLKGFILRRRKKEVMKDLPELIYKDVFVEPGKIDIEIDRELVNYIIPYDKTEDYLEEVEDQEDLLFKLWENLLGDSGNKFCEGLALLSSSVPTLRKHIGKQKVEPIVKLVKKELEEGVYNKVVIFAIHREVIRTLARDLEAYNPCVVHGQTHVEGRQREIDSFQNDPTCQIFIGNIMAAGTAIELTAAHNIIFLEQDWVPGNNAQAVMRCHRIGQTHPVLCRFIGIENTIDERISSVLNRKTQELIKIFDSGEII